MAKVRRSAVTMLEYGASRVWHSEESGLFIDRDSENTTWWLTKLYPESKACFTSLKSLRAVAKHEFGVDVDAEVWTA